MLPEPKKVARILRRIFQTAEERRQERDLNRDINLRMGKARLQRYLQSQKRVAAQLRTLAKRALSMNDEARFKQIGHQWIWTQRQIDRWERYLLSLEILQARRDQARASVELLSAVRTMSESLADMVGEQDMAELQRELETGLARASSLDERMAVMMEVMDATLATDVSLQEGDLDSLAAELNAEVVSEEDAAFDPQIEALRRKIQEELRDGS